MLPTTPVIPPYSVRKKNFIGETKLSSFSAPLAVSHDGETIAGKRQGSGFEGYRWTPAVPLLLMPVAYLPRSISDNGRIISVLHANSPPPANVPTVEQPWVWNLDDPDDPNQWLQEFVSSDVFGFGLPKLPFGTRRPAAIVSGDGLVYTMAGSNAVVKVAPLEYVALGDSFSSGEGVISQSGFEPEPFVVGTDIPGVNECHRSRVSYPRLIRPRSSSRTLHFFTNPIIGKPGFDWTSRACSGAITRDVRITTGSDGQWNEGAQVSSLDSDTDLVTITIGGNDMFFEEVLFDCATSFDCENSVTPESPNGETWNDFLQDRIRGQLAINLKNVYERILLDAPNASVIVLGYPLLFDGTESCIDIVGASTAEQRFLNNLTTLLNRQVAQTAREVGVHFLPVVEDFDGHGVCSADPWINGWKPKNKVYSYHPRRRGQRAYANAVTRFLNEKGPGFVYGFFANGMPKNPTAMP